MVVENQIWAPFLWLTVAVILVTGVERSRVAAVDVPTAPSLRLDGTEWNHVTPFAFDVVDDSDKGSHTAGKTTSQNELEEDPPDPADPTRIETRVGAGYKYTQFTNYADLHELRAKFGLLTGSGIFVVDIGVGATFDAPNEDDEFGVTDGRFRYFHLFEMDRTVPRGWRGWGSSVELQTQGSVPGTDGANLLALGALGAFGVAKGLSVFPNPILANVWSRDFDEYLGVAVRIDLITTYKPDYLWRGAYVKVKPSYGYGLSDDIEDEGAFQVEWSIGGAIDQAKTWWWDIQARTQFDKDFDRVTTGRDSGLEEDWSVFTSFTRFF